MASQTEKPYFVISGTSMDFIHSILCVFLDYCRKLVLELYKQNINMNTKNKHAPGEFWNCNSYSNHDMHDCISTCKVHTFNNNIVQYMIIVWGCPWHHVQ